MPNIVVQTEIESGPTSPSPSSSSDEDVVIVEEIQLELMKCLEESEEGSMYKVQKLIQFG